MMISVIVPVYNAIKYVEDAVHSALGQKQVSEVILVEDGSTDGSLELCQQLERQNERVRLLTHEGNANRGASVSRNLGVRESKNPFVAFLDADDVYLQDRFNVAEKILSSYPDVDGVYESIGAVYYDPELKSKHVARVGTENTGLRVLVDPAELFDALGTGQHGYIHLDGLVVRRHVFSDITFDEELLQSQDMDIMLRLAARFRLFPGDLTRVVALRGVHGANRVFNDSLARKYKVMYIGKAIASGFYRAGTARTRFFMVFRYVRLRAGLPKNYSSPANVIALGIVLFAYLVSHPVTIGRILSAPAATGAVGDSRIFTFGCA